MAAVAAVAFCGFIAALVAYAFAPEKLQGWKWLATVLLVFSVLIVPRVTVVIVDKTGGSAVKVVANVPFGVAFLGSVTSTVGHTLTGLFETAFQVIPGVGALPSELSYENNGLMFGNRLIRETGGVAFQDPNFRTDLVNFIHNCTMYDLIDGTVDPGTFEVPRCVIVGVGAAACCTVARGWPCVERVRRMPVGFGADDAGSSDRPAGAGGGPPAVRDAGVAGRSGDQGLSTRRHTGIRRVNWP
jgi:hypothetical protein